MTPNTTDLCDEHPDAVVLPAAFRDFGGTARFSGPVLTVKCFEDNSRVKELSLTHGDGRVLVVDGAGSLRCALLGDMIAADLLRNGWVGVVVHGCVRDRAALAALALGVKALATNPRRSQRKGEGEVGLEVDIGGAVVHTGDRVYADEDGIVVLPAAKG
jgi:regulator of ribonuclease activity A